MKVKPSKHPGAITLEMSRRDEPMLTAATATPFRLKEILVPIDFSPCSKKALQYALPLAKAQNAKITLLYVAPHLYSAVDFGGIASAQMEINMQESASQELAKLAKDEIPREITYENIVQLGSPAAEIVNVAKTLPADMVIVSTHGYTGFKHVVLGSVAEHIVRYAPCPVLVVREQERDLQFAPN
jgi:nucleotide-binding universal stress UspA family protein